MSFNYNKEKHVDSQDFGDEDPYAALNAAMANLDTPASAPDTSTPDTSSFTVPETPLVYAPPAAPVFAPDPEMQISKHFKLKDFLVTSHPISNLPDTQEDLDNLVKMGVVLDAILDNIGSFNIASVYRSQALQDVLRRSSTMAAKKSLHSKGMAADITPTNGMGTRAFAQAIYHNELLKPLIGQLVDKAEGGQTSLHISLPTSSFPDATPMYVGPGDQYFRYRGKELDEWSATKNLLDESSTYPGDLPTSQINPEDMVNPDEEADDSSPKPWGIIFGGLAAAVAALYFYKKRRT